MEAMCLRSVPSVEVQGLDQMVQRFNHQSLAPSTLPLHSMFSYNLTRSLCKFAAAMDQQDVPNTTINLRHPLPAVIAPGLGSLLWGFCVAGDQAQRGHGRHEPRPCLLITSLIMRLLKGAWEERGISTDTTMLWAAGT